MQVDFEHAGRAYSVEFVGEKARSVKRSRPGVGAAQWLDMHSPMAKEVVALARVKLIEQAMK